MTFVDGILIVLALAFLIALIRVAIGPTVADRAVAVDVCLFAVVASLGPLAVRLDAAPMLDAAPVATLLGFIATISLARLIGRRRP